MSDSPTNHPTENTVKNLNTILLWVTIAGLGFIGATSFNNSIALAKMEGSQMTRGEVEAKLAEVRSIQMVLEKDIAGIRLEVAKLVLSTKANTDPTNARN